MKHTLFKQRWFVQKVHISWHITALCIGVLAGVAIVGFSELSLTDYEWGGLAAALVIIAIAKRTRKTLLLMLIAGGIFGLLRGSGEQAALTAYKAYYDTQVTLQGVVTEDPTYGPKGDLRFKLKNVFLYGEQLAGTVWVSTTTNQDVKRGDTVVVSGKLQKGFGTIPASMFRANITNIERPVPGDIGRRLRDWFAVGVMRGMPIQEAQLALAFLVGQKLTVSEELNDDLRTVGLIHAVVASGYHLTVLIELIRRLLIKTSKYLTLISSTTLIGTFILITGFSPSMTRAGLVSGLGLVAWYYGRVIHPLVLLPCAAGITVLYQPEYVWGDVGWYLSFAAFAGVLLVAPLLNHYFWGSNARPGMVREIVLSTVSAQLLTLPIVVAVFSYYSAYALLANLLVVPLIPFTMLLTFISGVVGLLVPALASIFSLPLIWTLRYMLAVVDWIARLPSARTEFTLDAFGIVVSYLIIISFVVYIWYKTKHQFRVPNGDQKLF